MGKGSSTIKLLQSLGIARSSYYYHLKKLSGVDKYERIKREIASIYNDSYGQYGYRRVTAELRNRGYCINHKTVSRLMRQMGVRGGGRGRRDESRDFGSSYNSYCGDISEEIPNLINCDFKAAAPKEKWATDITELDSCFGKLYLSVILDLYNSEVVGYSIGDCPSLNMVMRSLNSAADGAAGLQGLILHSDHGWQYQNTFYRSRLKVLGARQSMSRKGNCFDNAVIENFFGILKKEFLYCQSFESPEVLRLKLSEYIDYYNKKRIKIKLGGLSPVLYREQHFCSQKSAHS